VEGYLMTDHVHMCIAILRKHSVTSVMGFLKGKSANRNRQDAGQGAEPYRRAFLGSRIRRIDGGVSNWSRSSNTSATKSKRMVRILSKP
jgi:REP element-mobilizing transposase RayT